MTTRTPEWRYPTSVDPVATDGRDIDTRVAMLDGEGAQQRAERDGRAATSASPAAWDRLPEVVQADPTYYDRPLLKRSPWSIDIPIYYFLGGMAGAALTLGAAIQLASPRGKHPLRRVSEICHWTGVAGSTAGAAFLIHDLGRPERFLYMMRVFRPTSPMNMGTWILGGAAPTAITTVLLINRRGFWGTVGEVTGYLSGIFGAALAGYTGVLVSNSAIPIWQQARRWVPPLFMASSAATAASVIDVISPHCRRCGLTRVFGTAGRVAEIAASKMVERAAGEFPKLGEPLHKGGTAILWRLASTLTSASLGASLLRKRRPRASVVAGLLGIAGSLCLRFAVHYISNASANDPRAAFHQQRAVR